MAKRLELSTAKRVEAVLSLVRREEPAAKIARRYGISEQTLYRLRDDFLQGGQDALAERNGRGTGRDCRVEELEKDVAERDRVIGELTIANRLLKKVGDGRY